MRAILLVAGAAQAKFGNWKENEVEHTVPRDATSDLILVAFLRRGVEEKHLRYAISRNNIVPAQRAVLQKVLDGKPAWCEVCSAIMNLKLCKCISVAYCSKECQHKDWKKHKMVCASSVNQAVLTEERAAIARDEQKKKIKPQRKRAAKKK
jgi:hypothetical protein